MYALKHAGGVTPLTGLVDPKLWRDEIGSTIVVEHDPAVRAAITKMMSAGQSPEGSASTLRELLCCLPPLDAPLDIDYTNLFRVVIMQFIDAHSFDLRAIRRTCVHIVHPDGRVIPFDTYNLFYRDDLETTRLAPLRAMAEQAVASG